MFKKNIFGVILNICLVICLLLYFSSFIFAGEEKYVLKLAHYSMIGGFEDRCCHKFKEIAEEKSNGKLEVNIYPGGQLGEETECAQGVLMGTIPMTIVCPFDYRDIVDGFGIDSLPFLFDSVDKSINIFNFSEIGKRLEERLIQKGGRILGWHTYGARHLIFADKDVKTYKDLQGLKMRSPEGDMWIKMFESMGTRPTPITWGEAYLSLQTGVADGMDTPIVDIKIMHFYEVTKYCLLTGHMLGNQILLINEKVFQELPSELQEIVLYAGKEAINYINQVVKEEVSETKKWLEEEGGVKFTELKEEEREKFKKVLMPIQKSWAEEHNCVDLLNDIIEMQK